MANVVAYRRPATVQQALALLGRPSTVVLAGGTQLVAASGTEPVEVVDLQALGFDRIERHADGRLSVGSMVRLQALAEDVRVPQAVRDAARRELPSTLRNAATVGGCVAAGEPDSELLATLLVHDARVHSVGMDGSHKAALDALLADRALIDGRVLTGVTIETGGVTSGAWVGRTRADRPLVAAVARRSDAGVLRLALAGVASTPMLVDALGALDPPDDHRGSREYRVAMAATLAARVLEELGP
jgi:CO/xanthine dehydrogenase FAD-binding subunit